MIVYTLILGPFYEMPKHYFSYLLCIYGKCKSEKKDFLDFKICFSLICYFNEERGKFFLVLHPPCYCTTWYTIRSYNVLPQDIFFNYLQTVKLSAKVVFNDSLITFIHQLVWRQHFKMTQHSILLIKLLPTIFTDST